MIFLNALVAAASLASAAISPVYITLAPTVHDYVRFADGGPDANWYIGFNNAWIVKLPPAPEGSFQKAFIGAKLGRAKSRPDPDRPWRRERIPGQVYIGISPTPFWSAEQGFFLADAADIPAEPDPQARVNGVGAAEWFWAEIPPSLVNSKGSNYLVVWSPTNEFTGDDAAPILAAADDFGADGGEARAWNNRSIQGVPPRSAAGSLETPINRILPALAIELVPAGGGDSVVVNGFSATPGGKGLLARFSVSGRDVSAAWIESSRDGLDWSRATPFRREPPYLFDLPAGKAVPGDWLRGAARDVAGNSGYSEPFRIPYAQSR